MHVSAALTGKVVLITGASSGIGAATARLCAAQGARVLLAARRENRLMKLAQELGEERALPVVCDVRNRDDVHQAFHMALRHLGGLDVVVNNAGRGMYAPVAEMDLTAWQELWSTNVQGALHVMQEAAHTLGAGGVIVNVASIAGKVTAPHMGGYSATKFALVALSDALRMELARRSIRVVTVYPGSTETEFRKQAIGSGQMVDKRITRVSAERVAQSIVAAAAGGRSHVWVTWQDHAAAKLGQMFPGLTERVLSRTLLPQEKR